MEVVEIFQGNLAGVDNIGAIAWTRRVGRENILLRSRRLGQDSDGRPIHCPVKRMEEDRINCLWRDSDGQMGIAQVAAVDTVIAAVVEADNGGEEVKIKRRQHEVSSIVLGNGLEVCHWGRLRLRLLALSSLLQCDANRTDGERQEFLLTENGSGPIITGVVLGDGRLLEVPGRRNTLLLFWLVHPLLASLSLVVLTLLTPLFAPVKLVDDLLAGSDSYSAMASSAAAKLAPIEN